MISCSNVERLGKSCELREYEKERDFGERHAVILDVALGELVAHLVEHASVGRAGVDEPTPQTA